MSLIRNQKFYPCGKPNPKYALFMCWFGGSIWQSRRLIKVLNNAGYDVTALDFPKSVLSAGDPTLLPALADEVTLFSENIAKKTQKPILLVGVSLGGLMALNVARRSRYFNEAILITGGDIAKAAKRFYAKAWSLSYKDLAYQWREVNMYTKPELITGKKFLFVLHPSSRVIDAQDLYQEIAKQQKHGNIIHVVERHRFDHLGTIVQEAAIYPKRLLNYINILDKA